MACRCMNLEKVSVLGTNGRFMKNLSQKFTFKAKRHESRKFKTTKIWRYMALAYSDVTTPH